MSNLDRIDEFDNAVIDKYNSKKREWDDNGFSTVVALTWIDKGFTIVDAIKWRRAVDFGYTGVADEAEHWCTHHGFTVKEYLHWSPLVYLISFAFPVNIMDVQRCKRLGYTRKDIDPFLLIGIPIWVATTVLTRLAEVGIEIPNILDWLRCDYDIEEIIKWVQEGKDLKYANSQRTSFEDWKSLKRKKKSGKERGKQKHSP